jgi:hypothetical protein
VITCPAESFKVSVSEVEVPAEIVGAGGSTLIVATGTSDTTIDVVPSFPSTEAVTTIDPGLFAVISPPDETLATSVSLDVQVISRPVITPPDASSGSAAA